MLTANKVLEILTTPGSVVLDGNLEQARYLTERFSYLVETKSHDTVGLVTVWHMPHASPVVGPRIVLRPTQHLAFYGTHGRRILGTDPEGTPLHECEWHGLSGVPNSLKMTRARIQLDCGQWVGIRSETTEQTSAWTLPPPTDPKEATPEALRRIAAKAWGVPIEDVRYFFPDASFSRDENDRVLIRIKKDGLYLLEDGTFDRARFVSYMGAIPWRRIDLLNVVELYQSTLPGTGGAAFDLIWGLCDDQRLAEGPIPLRYRGLPTFPSEQAYGMFCAFFKPDPPEGEDAYKLFMDPQQSFKVNWWPRPDPPWRYFDRSRGLCITAQNGAVQKVTVLRDPVAVPYVNSGMKGFASCDRKVGVTNGLLELWDSSRKIEMPLNPRWGITQETSPIDDSHAYPFEWRVFFKGNLPEIDPGQAWTTALYFPENGSEVGEQSTQLFVLEQIYEYLNQIAGLRARLERIHRVLVHDFDPVCAGFIDPDNRAREYTILYHDSLWAQKNAQMLWDRAAREGRLETIRFVEFMSAERQGTGAYRQPYDLIYRWIPYADYDDPPRCRAIVKAVAEALTPSGLGFVVGPPSLISLFPAHGLFIHSYGGAEDLTQLSVVQEHLRIHPDTRVNRQLTVIMGEKRQ